MTVVEVVDAVGLTRLDRVWPGRDRGPSPLDHARALTCCPATVLAPALNLSRRPAPPRPAPPPPRRPQHGGFKPLAAAVSASGATPAERNTKLLWGVGLVTFFLSAMLDNLTTTIVMLSVLQVGRPAGGCSGDPAGRS
jgi:hypothetical protein